MNDPKYNLLAEDLGKQGVRIDAIKELLKRQHVETPSWGYGNSGRDSAYSSSPGRRAM